MFLLRIIKMPKVSCGVCRFLRNKCDENCICAPYFLYPESAETFAAIHQVFGYRNFLKLLRKVPEENRGTAVLTLSYEAQARLHNPIFGSASYILSLEMQILNLQAQLTSLNQLPAQNFASSSSSINPHDIVGGHFLSHPPNHHVQSLDPFENVHMAPLLNQDLRNNFEIGSYRQYEPFNPNILQDHGDEPQPTVFPYLRHFMN